MRTAGDYTVSVRALIDADKTITHKQARQLLIDQGYEMAAEVEASENTEAFLKHKPDLSDPNSVSAAIKACGFDEKTAKAVIKQAHLVKAYAAERNMFNVTKSTYLKKIGASSRKPEANPNGKSNAAAAVVGAKRGRKPKVETVATEDYVSVIAANGGLAACQAKIAELQSAVDAFVELQDRLKSAA